MGGREGRGGKKVARRGRRGEEGEDAGGQSWCHLLSGTVQLKLQLHSFIGSPTPGISPIHPQQGVFPPTQSQIPTRSDVQ